MKKMIITAIAAAAFCPVTNADRPAKPNVVLMLCDDLGWQDVKCYDIDEPSPYETPNIDRLARMGVLFRQGYSPAPTCAPSRCSIISGKHPARLQKTHVVGGHPPTPHSKKIHRVMPPWYSGRLDVDEVSIAKALKTNGYRTGHSGKWHIAINHNAYPQPKDHGFDESYHDLGESKAMRPHRLTGFATDAPDDPYQLDEKGFPKDQTTLDAIQFMENSKEDPFFLFYAAWLVHTPIHSRSKELLEKYCKKLGFDFPTDPKGWDKEGQNNPYYCAMVEMLDAYIGQLMTYLETTEDPRWPGHKLIENTYIIFTSDNGGMERHPGEIITDNYPLDRGKINAKEGGTRVPFIITGPKIEAGVDSNVMVNGLDFYPTILSWTNTKKPAGVELDGADLSNLLAKDPMKALLVKTQQGKPRTSMMWHFPNSVAMQSTVRIGDYKLIYNHDHVGSKHKKELELYQLYKRGSKRGDIEEAKNLAAQMPEKAQQMKSQLFSELKSMEASMPYYNPYCKFKLPGKESVCKAVKADRAGNRVAVSFIENGAKVVKGYLMYTQNGGHRYEEWFRKEAVVAGNTLSTELPEGTTHYLFNLIDENNYLVSYPELDDQGVVRTKKKKYSSYAISVK